MATNQILPFGANAGANVLSPAEYAALAARGSGFQAGVAKSKEVNTALRQAAFAAAMVGQFTANKSGLDVLDNGDVTAFEAAFLKAVIAGVPLATFLQHGLARLATDTETAVGTDFTVAVSPGALSARTASDVRTGLIKITTSALAQGLVDDATAITPKKLADAFKGANWNASSPGYVRLPNGMILQWGSAAGFNSYNVVFPIAFPSGPLMAPLAVCIGPDDYDAPNAAWAEASNFPTPTTCKIFVYKPGPTGGAVSTAQAICWFCIGI